MYAWIVVIVPTSIPNSFCKALTIGANELVVHEPAETILSSGVKVSWLTP